MYTAITHWNELPKDIKAVTKEHRFKGAAKRYLFDKMEQSNKSDFLFFFNIILNWFVILSIVSDTVYSTCLKGLDILCFDIG